MKPKEFIDLLPVGYVRERNLNGSIYLSLNTEGTSAVVFIKKIPQNRRMPAVDQDSVDMIQRELGADHLFIDWYSDNSCRFMIDMAHESDATYYHLMLNAFFGGETFELRGSFYEKGNKGIRESVYNERYLPKLPNDAVTTNADFAAERYDIIFPDHPLSHCRRLANVIAMNTPSQAETSSQITSSSDSDSDDADPE